MRAVDGLKGRGASLRLLAVGRAVACQQCHENASGTPSSRRRRWEGRGSNIRVGPRERVDSL